MINGQFQDQVMIKFSDRFFDLTHHIFADYAVD